MPRSQSLVLAGAGLLAAMLVAGTASAHYQAALKDALAKSGGKPVLVDFYTDW